MKIFTKTRLYFFKRKSRSFRIRRLKREYDKWESLLLE
ncbi:hypothetical protein LEP1GSC051_1086 [Leptospira sp. P2653]|nr:hypothetical protein LEP1GSC051_1086 [Leptospira sp. P2653]